jgi:CelD/BcsL family acetyltransferase involved in cellulose biosynthesis
MIVAKLSLDGKTTAIEAGFRHGESFHIYLRAFAPEFAHFGPGNILTQHMIEWCAANGVTRYDMLAPGSRNKSEWQTGEVEVSDIILPMTTRGRLYAATVALKIAPALRSAFYALPERLRATIAGVALRL